MRLVRRSDIVDYVTYDDRRASRRAEIREIKAKRRIHLGECLTFLFENSDTLGYQVQEIMRAERIVRESDIAHEIDTYNALLGEPGDLGCVLLIEIADPGERAVRLAEWVGLPEHVYLRLADGSRVAPECDPDQVGTDPQGVPRLSAVQYLRFPVEGKVPVAIGIDFEPLTAELELTAETVSALTEDLARS